MKYPELRYLGRDMWSELTRGLYDASSLFYEMTTRISQRDYFYDENSTYSTLLRLLPLGLEPRDEPAKLRWKAFKESLNEISNIASIQISAYKESFRNTPKCRDSLREFESKLSPTLPTEDIKKEITVMFDRLWWSHVQGKENQNIGANYLVLYELEYETEPEDIRQRRIEKLEKMVKAKAKLEKKVLYSLELLGEKEVSANFEKALRYDLDDDLRFSMMSLGGEITDEEHWLIVDLVEKVKEKGDLN